MISSTSAPLIITKALLELKNGDGKPQSFRKVALNCEALKIYDVEGKSESTILFSMELVKCLVPQSSFWTLGSAQLSSMRLSVLNAKLFIPSSAVSSFPPVIKCSSKRAVL